MSLGEKLKKTLADFEAEGIRRSQAETQERLEKHRAIRQGLHEFVDTLRTTIISDIENGRIPSIKIENYDRQRWIQGAINSRTRLIQNSHFDIWDEHFIQWAESNGLGISVKEEHDGMGMETWIRIKVDPL